MATLEKIRSKSVFLIIVIGVALLAFIVGDALTNSRNLFGDHTMVAKLGNVKIDYTEYQRKREELNNQYEQARRQNPAQFANFDTQLLPQMALDQLIQETLVNNAAEKAGIIPTANLLRHYMFENPQNQEVGMLLQQLQGAGISAQTPQQAYDIIFNPKRNGLTEAQVEPLQRAWLAAEKRTEKMIAAQIYQSLLAGTVQPNELDRKALYDDYVNTTNVELAYHPYGQLSEKDYPVSDSELKALYDKEKERFAVDQATKNIAFIGVSIMPSKADIEACNKLAENTTEYMKSHAGALSKEIKKEGVNLVHNSLRASDIPAGALKEFITTQSADTVRMIATGNTGFTIARKSRTISRVDSVQVNVISTATDDLGTRLMARLNAGYNPDSISSNYSLDSVSVQLDQWIPLFTAEGATNALPESTLDSLRAASGKYIALQQGPQGALIAKLVKQTAPVTVYEYDEASYVLGPSSKTLNDERDKLEKFLADNNNAAKFVENAGKSGYNLQEFVVTESNAAIPRFQGMNQYYPDSRQVVRWVMIDGKKDHVSHIYESKDPVHPNLYAAAVIEAYDTYEPLTSKDVKDYLTRKVRNAKAGEKLAAEYSKKAQSLQSAAQAMGAVPRNISDFRFGQNPGINDPGIVGMIAGGKADKKVVVAPGLDGIYVFQISGRNTENFPFNEQMYNQQYYQMVNPDMASMLKGNAKFKNNIYKFEAGD